MTTTLTFKARIHIYGHIDQELDLTYEQAQRLITTIDNFKTQIEPRTQFFQRATGTSRPEPEKPEPIHLTETRRTYRRMSPHQAKRVIDDICNGLKTLNEIADEHNITLQAVKAIAGGRSHLATSGFEPWNTRDLTSDPWSPRYYNRTPTGAMTKRGRDIAAKAQVRRAQAMKRRYENGLLKSKRSKRNTE